MKTIDEVKSVEKRVSKPVIVDNDSELVSNEDKPTMSTEPLEITVELDSTTLTVVESTTAVEPTTIVEPVVASQGDENIPQVVEIPNPTSENKEQSCLLINHKEKFKLTDTVTGMEKSGWNRSTDTIP